LFACQALDALFRYLPLAQLQWIPWGLRLASAAAPGVVVGEGEKEGRGEGGGAGREEGEGGGGGGNGEQGGAAEAGAFDLVELALTEWEMYEYYLSQLQRRDPATHALFLSL